MENHVVLSACIEELQALRYTPAGGRVDVRVRHEMQAANDAKNLDDIREFVSPEMFAEIKLQMDERGNVPQQTDIVTLNAELQEVVSEGAQHIASVHFSGMIREEANTAAVPFEEIWHLSKPVAGSLPEFSNLPDVLMACKP